MDEASRNQIPFFFAIDYLRTECIFIPYPDTQEKVLYAIRGVSNSLPGGSTPAEPPSLKIDPIPYQRYLSSYEIIRAGLLRGDSFLANLTVPTRIELPLSLEELYRMTNAPYRLYVPDRFVCFSPEAFVRTDKKGWIHTYPMKGTIDASVEHAQEKIRNDYKETAEHCTIVDLLRNDLSQVATSVRVEKFRYITRIHSSSRDLLQVSSEIIGKLRPSYIDAIGSLVDRLLPAGSITGAPKEATCMLLAEAEIDLRGYYTGVAGIYQAGVLDSFVLIRYIERDERGGYLFRSGGGITVNSDPQDEYAEVIEKVYLPR